MRVVVVVAKSSERDCVDTCSALVHLHAPEMPWDGGHNDLEARADGSLVGVAKPSKQDYFDISSALVHHQVPEALRDVDVNAGADHIPVGIPQHVSDLDSALLVRVVAAKSSEQDYVDTSSALVHPQVPEAPRVVDVYACVDHVAVGIHQHAPGLDSASPVRVVVAKSLLCSCSVRLLS